MPRPTTAARCCQEISLVVAGRPTTAPCTKSENHKGDHQVTVTAPRGAAPPPRR
jgi:hypothetical protein